MPEQPAPRWDDPSMWSPHGVPAAVGELELLPEPDAEVQAAPPPPEEKKPGGEDKEGI